MKLKTLSLVPLVLVSFIFSTDQVFAQKRRKSPPRPVVRITGVPVTTAATPAIVTGSLTPETQKRLDTFRVVWETIRDNYFDQTFGGLNWYDIRKEFESRVKSVETDRQFYSLLEEMVGRLNKSHFAIIPPDVFEAIATAKKEARERRGRHSAKNFETESDEPTDEADLISAGQDDLSKFGLGIELRIIDDKFVISRVEKGSAGEYQGLKTGFIVEKINGVVLADLLRKVDVAYANIRNIRTYLPLEILNYLLNGPEDSYVDVTYLDQTNQPKDLHILRERLKGQTVSIGKNYPEFYFRFENYPLNDDVGYIRFNLFAMPVIDKFCSALTDFKNKKAIIVDLRGNSGGLMGTMVALGGMLTNGSVDLGTQMYKSGSDHLFALSKPKHFDGRLVFLVDNQTMSAGEIFSAALQENDRAIVVGSKTAGAALPAVSKQLPNGAVLVYPIANYKTKKGTLLEGKGVEPDFEVPVTRQELLDGRDPQLEEALNLIKEDKVFPKPPVISTTLSGIGSPVPPPPAKKEAPKLIGKTLATVTVKAPAPPVAKPQPDIKDAESLRIISDFAKQIGGADALEKIKSYEMNGNVQISAKSTSVDMSFTSLRQGPDKYGEYMTSDVTGEIREVYDGKNHYVQADYGLESDLPLFYDASQAEMLAPILTTINSSNFRSLEYKGSFDRSGKKAYVIAARSNDGTEIGLAFDVETKMLVSYTRYGFSLSYGDYRKVGDVTLPFSIEREPIMKIQLHDIKLNPDIDQSRFMKKQNCFNIPN